MLGEGEVEIGIPAGPAGSQRTEYRPPGSRDQGARCSTWNIVPRTAATPSRGASGRVIPRPKARADIPQGPEEAGGLAVPGGC